MSSKPLTNILIRKLAEVNPATGRTFLADLIAVAREKAASGDEEFARIVARLERSGRIRPGGDP